MKQEKTTIPVLLVPLKQIATLALPGSLSAPSAALATGRERHIWVKRAREDAKGEIKNAELPQKN